MEYYYFQNYFLRSLRQREWEEKVNWGVSKAEEDTEEEAGVETEGISTRVHLEVHMSKKSSSL